MAVRFSTACTRGFSRRFATRSFVAFREKKPLASRVYSRTYRGKEERISKKTEFNIFLQSCTKAGELTVLAGMFVFPFQTLGKFLSKYFLTHVH